MLDRFIPQRKEFAEMTFKMQKENQPSWNENENLKKMFYGKNKSIFKFNESQNKVENEGFREGEKIKINKIIRRNSKVVQKGE